MSLRSAKALHEGRSTSQSAPMFAAKSEKRYDRHTRARVARCGRAHAWIMLDEPCRRYERQRYGSVTSKKQGIQANR